MQHRLPSVILAALISASAIGCGDPGLGVSGTISLDPNANPADFQTLEIRAFPDSSNTWTLGDGIPDTDLLFSQTFSLSEISMPYSYSFLSLGTVPKKQYRLVAWITTDASSTAPTSGDWWGTSTFTFKSCGTYGDYCGDPSGKDVLIDQFVPYPTR